jgi:hypothetical protein
MAVGTIDLPLGYVGVVHEGHVGVFIQAFGLIVTIVTPVLGRMAFALDDIPVALLAGDVARPHKIEMVKSESLELNILLGNFMAGGATAQGKLADLPFGGLEMAEVAGAIRYFNVCAYDDLAVAARAAELLAPPQVSQVEPVIEANSFFVSHLPRQDVRGMATRPQAAGVFDLGVRLGAVFSGYQLDYVVDGLEFGPHRRLGLGRHMTGYTGHLIVIRSFPGLIIGSHDVATVAEGRAGAIEEEAGKEDQEGTTRDSQHNIELGMEMDVNPDPF